MQVSETFFHIHFEDVITKEKYILSTLRTLLSVHCKVSHDSRKVGNTFKKESILI